MMWMLHHPDDLFYKKLLLFQTALFGYHFVRQQLLVPCFLFPRSRWFSSILIVRIPFLCCPCICCFTPPGFGMAFVLAFAFEVILGITFAFGIALGTMLARTLAYTTPVEKNIGASARSKKTLKLLYFVWSPPWHLYIDLLLANLLAFYLTYLLAFDLAFYLAYLLAFYLAYLLAYVLAYYLAFYLAYHLAFYLAYLLAFYLTISSGILSGISSGILSGMLSGVLSGISSGILSGRWGPAVLTELGRSQVEVQRCSLNSAGPRLRSSGAQCAQTLAVEVQQCPLRAEVGEELGEELAMRKWTWKWRQRWWRRRRRRTTLIKSNNPHSPGRWGIKMVAIQLGLCLAKWQGACSPRKLPWKLFSDFQAAESTLAFCKLWN